MKGVFITARLGSTRLSEKHLIKVEGKTLIEWLAKRFQHEFNPEIKREELKIFITTSVLAENRKFEALFKGTDISVFYGSDQNIPERHLECAKANNIDTILSIDGDDILCSPTAARMVVEELNSGSSYVSTKGLPLGMNVTGYTRTFLEESLNGINSQVLETGWGKIFDVNKIRIIAIDGCEEENNLRLTLDYPDDSLFFKKIIEFKGKEIVTTSDKELIDLIIENGFDRINSALNEEYWVNFNKQKQLEE